MPTQSTPNPIKRSQKANVGCLTAFAAMTLRLGQSSSAELQCASECPPPFVAPFYTIGHSLLSACVKEGGRSTILPAFPPPRTHAWFDAPCTLTFSSFLCVRRATRARGKTRAPAPRPNRRRCGPGGFIYASIAFIAKYHTGRNSSEGKEIAKIH